MDPLEWQISQDTANSIAAWLANTVGAAESVLRVAATGHDKRLFLKVFLNVLLIFCFSRLVIWIGFFHSFLWFFMRVRFDFYARPFGRQLFACPSIG